MAEKRMFSKKIIDTDWFMDMPASTQNLYFHLSMRADDDGFVASPKRISKLIGATEDDYKILIAKKFVIPCETGICVISDGRINNYLRTDRYTETTYKDEKNMLTLNENGKYQLGIPSGIPMVTPVLSISNSNTISNSSINKDRVVGEEKKLKHKYGEYKRVLLTDEELEKLNKEFGEEKTQKAITYLDEYIEMKGAKYKSHYLAMRKWVFNAVEEKEQKSTKTNDKGKSTKDKQGGRQYSSKDYQRLYDNLDEVNI